MGGLSRRLFKGASEMGNRQAALTREVSQSEFAIQALPQDLLGAPHLPGCQTAADQARVDASHVNVRGARMLGGDQMDRGDLLGSSTCLNRAGRVYGDAVVAANGQGDRKGDEFVHLHAKQAVYGGDTPGRLVALHDIGADSADRRRERGSAHGSWAPVDSDSDHWPTEGPCPCPSGADGSHSGSKCRLQAGPS